MTKVIVILGGIFLLHVLLIVFYGVFAKDTKSDLIVILGNKVELSGTPSKRLRARLEEGLKLYQEGVAPRILVSGGIGKEGFDEARIMATFLSDRGVPVESIIQDNHGITTYASAHNTKIILEEMPGSSVTVVSQYYHLLRSKIAFQKAGVRTIYTSPTKFHIELRDAYSVVREIIGTYYYIFRSYEVK